jgi:hypothetical protein
VIAIITPVYGWFAEGFDMPLKEAKALEGLDALPIGLWLWQGRRQ